MPASIARDDQPRSDCHDVLYVDAQRSRSLGFPAPSPLDRLEELERRVRDMDRTIGDLVRALEWADVVEVVIPSGRIIAAERTEPR